jgi:hypothetical protein
MGEKRWIAARAYAVIGIFDDELSWVGLHPIARPWEGYAPQLLFKHYLPELSMKVPMLASRVKRYAKIPLLSHSTNRLDVEIKMSLKLAIKAPPTQERPVDFPGGCPPRETQLLKLTLSASITTGD